MPRTTPRIAIVATVLLSAHAAWAAPTADHMQCFKIKDAATKVAYSADLTPTNPLFPLAVGCTISVPAKLLCIDVAKSNVAPPPPGSPEGDPAQSYLCYKTKCTKTQPALTVSDQFGAHPLTVKSTGLVCAPIDTVATPTCSDGLQNGSETDIDCGGGTCATCDDGMTCGAGSDCTSGSCSASTCVALLVNGSACASGTQCASGFCTDGFCCDGACSATCEACSAVKKGSGADGSCGNISNGTDPDSECVTTCDGAGACAGPTCTDTVQNGSETDVDCGGGVCATCDNGMTCGAGSDCTSGSCSASVCVPQTFTLIAAKSGSGTGTVTSSPAGISCGIDCSEAYNSGTMVTLTATPGPTSTFVGWSGGGCSGTGVCNVTMTTATTVTATFGLPTFTLTVSKAGAGTGTVISSPAGITCGADCSEAYNSGTMVTLTATPGGASTFGGWSGGGCSGTGVCNVTMTTATTVTATFSP